MACTLSLMTEETSATVRFSKTTGVRLATLRIAWSPIREALRMTPSTRGSSRSTASRSIGSDSWVSTTSMVNPPA